MKNSFLTASVQFVVRHALKFMFAGMAVAGVGFFLFMRYRFYGGRVRTAFFVCAVAGLVMYFIGRVSYAYSRRMKDKADRADRDRTESESLR